jgi:hypothetical protein
MISRDQSRNPLIDGLACAVKKCIDEGKAPYFNVNSLNDFCKKSEIFADYPIRGAKDTAGEATVELLKAFGLVQYFNISSPFMKVSRKIVDRFYERIPRGEREQFRGYGNEIVEASLCDCNGKKSLGKERMITAYDPNNSEHQF